MSYLLIEDNVPNDSLLKQHYENAIVDYATRESRLMKRLGYKFVSWYDATSEQHKEKIARMKYLIATGYGEDAAQIAKELATMIYNDDLGRRVCEITGNTYFDTEYNY